MKGSDSLAASDSWIVENLENALGTWNEKLAEIWQLITQSPQDFKGGVVWEVTVDIHGAVMAIGLGFGAASSSKCPAHHDTM